MLQGLQTKYTYITVLKIYSKVNYRHLIYFGRVKLLRIIVLYSLLLLLLLLSVIEILIFLFFRINGN